MSPDPSRANTARWGYLRDGRGRGHRLPCECPGFLAYFLPRIPLCTDLFPKGCDMQPELLLFDIGNTCIKVGLADSRGVTTTYNLRTDPAQTSDSLGLTLLELLRHAGAAPRFTACVASSVVPGFDPLLREAVERYLACPLWMVPQDLPIPLQNHYERPQEVGADRLVGAYEARRLYAEPESPARPSPLTASAAMPTSAA